MDRGQRTIERWLEQGAVSRKGGQGLVSVGLNMGWRLEKGGKVSKRGRASHPQRERERARGTQREQASQAIMYSEREREKEHPCDV